MKKDSPQLLFNYRDAHFYDDYTIDSLYFHPLNKWTVKNGAVHVKFGTGDEWYRIGGIQVAYEQYLARLILRP
jgi:hypothetical protein